MWTEVESSNIQALNHSESTLKVLFKSGSVYSYENVSVEMFEELLTAESVGSTFWKLVRSQPERFPHTKH